MLLSSYPNQAHDPEIFQKQLILLCTGQPKEVLKRMVDPRSGLLSQADFTPSISKVKDWLDKQQPSAPVFPPRVLPEPAWTPPTVEQRARCLLMAKNARAQLLDTIEAMRISGRIQGKRAPAPIQVDNPRRRQEALDNLQTIMPQAHRNSA
jgi:hypothetical protein